MKRLAGSFRDPSGHVYEKEGGIFRTINARYHEEFTHFIDSGLCQSLLDKDWIIPFVERPDAVEGAWKTIQSDKIPFITYPYEWSFSQLKDAALRTLDIQLEALRHDMVLKDASAYNIQFYKGAPVLIDTLSFERYHEGMPWQAYRQFIMHFFGPLALMAHADIRHGLQLCHFIDGLPLDYISRALPVRSYASLSQVFHIHLHAMLQKKYSGTKEAAQSQIKAKKPSLSRQSVVTLTKNLHVAISSLTLPNVKSEWGNYYSDMNYTEESFCHKQEVIAKITERFSLQTVCDLGANDGTFSRIFARNTGLVIAADMDAIAVEKNYLHSRKNAISNIMPVLQDLTNPSPAIGWENTERLSFIERAKCDAVAGLAFIHHLCIGHNIPLEYVSRFFHSLAPVAIVEFVPKEDSQAQRLLSSRKDIFDDYSLRSYISAFGKYYSHIEQHEIRNSGRVLLLCY